MLDETLVARIYIWDTEGNVYVGTGYPILPHVLLTARHVIEHKDRDDKQGIHIVWSECKCKQDDETLDIINNSDPIIYDGEGQYDLVLLRCATPPLTKKNTAKLPVVFPARQQSYECRGFPLAGEDDKGHDAIPVHGHVVGGYHTEQLELIADTDMTEETGWGGLSGAPVFIGDHLYGVMKIKQKKVEKLLYATSIPYLIHKSTAFQKAVGLSKQAVSKELTHKLHAILIEQIEDILHNGDIPLNQLSRVLSLSRGTTKAVLAHHLVTALTAYDALNALLKMSLQIEARLKSKEDQWLDYLYDIEQLCGWLLINSVEPSWWLENARALLKEANTNLSTTISTENERYIEVIISRSLLQKAEYTLDTEKKELVPALHNALLFDASSKRSSDEQILGAIFKDLRHTDNAPADIDELLEAIQATVMTLYEANEKAIYYILSQEYLEQLQDKDWYKDIEQKMRGYFQFICCDVNDKQAISPSNHDQKALLEKVAAIMRLRNK